MSILFLFMPVCAFLHLQPAALSQFETCHPISIIIKALHFPTKQGIGFPCLWYLSISALCTCPVPLSALWDVSISLLADLRSVKLNLAKLLQCQQRYQGTDWAFHKHPWQPPAEASWLFLWQNAVGFMGKAVAWHCVTFIHYPTLPRALWGTLNPDSLLFEAGRSWGGSEHHQGPGSPQTSG